MFSPRERDFLRSIIRTRSEGPLIGVTLEGAFPNPIYRRKLMWGIRRKAAQAAEDWELYLRAARLDPKVVPVPSGSAAVPLATEPLVTLGRILRSALRRGPGAQTESYPTKGRKERG